MTDQQIIQLIRNRQTDKALGILYRHFPMIRKLITEMGGTKQDAEDIFQESLIIFCRKARDYNFNLTAQLSTYLYSVCRFLWKDELKKRTQLPASDFESGLSMADEENIRDSVEEDKRIKMAQKILDELGDRCRDLLLLFYKGGLRLKDIASKMGYASEAAAKNQKYKCLENARNKLKELQQISSTY